MYVTCVSENAIASSKCGAGLCQRYHCHRWKRDYSYCGIGWSLDKHVQPSFDQTVVRLVKNYRSFCSRAAIPFPRHRSVSWSLSADTRFQSYEQRQARNMSITFLRSTKRSTDPSAADCDQPTVKDVPRATGDNQLHPREHSAGIGQ